MKYQHLKRLFCILAMSLFLTACAHINFWTALKFSNVDFLDVNPETARVALVLPEGVNLETITATVHGTADGNVILDYTVPMELIHNGPELAELPASIPREQLIVVRVPRADIGRTRQIQLETAQFLERRSGNNNLSLGFVLSNGREDEELNSACSDDAEPLSIAVWVRLDKNSAYSKLISGNAFAKIVEQSVKQSHCM